MGSDSESGQTLRWHTPKPKRPLSQLTELALRYGPVWTRRYQYHQLEHGHIRVLCIERSKDFNSLIQCTLRHGPIHWNGDFQPYMTVSYAWGEVKEDDSHLDTRILCDNEVICVSNNLDTALRCIRHKYEQVTQDIFVDPLDSSAATTVPIWVDAICINQADPIEKNAQVRSMARVYANSSRLIIWLGWPDQAQLTLERDNGPTDMSDRISSAMYESPWLRRRWVIQEYGLTPIHSRFFLFGIMLFDRDILINLEQIEKKKSLPLPKWIGNYDLFSPYNPTTSLLYNLCSFDGALCSDPRDIVYSLLSLSFESLEIANIQVDYRMSVEEVFIDAATSILDAGTNGSDRLCLLLAIACAKRETNLRDRKLPTWCPDWRIATQRMLLDQERAIDSLLQSLRDMQTASENRSEERAAPVLPTKEGVTAIYEWPLSISGTFLHPCFPPAHSSQRGSSQQERDRCRTCVSFISAWKGLSADAKALLENVRHRKQFLFRIAGSRTVLILDQCDVPGISTISVFELVTFLPCSEYPWDVSEPLPEFLNEIVLV